MNTNIVSNDFLLNFMGRVLILVG